MKTKILAYLALALACVIACSTSSQGPTAVDASVATVSVSVPPRLAASSDGGRSLIQDRNGRGTAPKSAPKMKAAIDSRTPQQLALAACAGPNGSWSCSMSRPMMASSTQQPITPPSWTISDWYFDAANTTGCASDSNSCTSATCTSAGVGPCVKVAEMVTHRWGTPQPVLTQTTTLHINSTETLNQEEIVLQPVQAEGVNFIIEGAAGETLVATFNLGAVTSKNRATGTLLSAAGFGGGGIAVGQLVVNQATGSHATIQALVAGTATLSQPLAHITPTQYPAPAEDDTWTVGQQVKVYSQPLLNLKVARPEGADSNGTTTGLTWINGIHVPDVSGTPGNSTFAPQLFGQVVGMQDSLIDPYVSTNGGVFGANSSSFINCGLSGAGNFSTADIMGGFASTFSVVLGNGGLMDLDHIAGQGIYVFPGRSFIGYAYVPSGKSIHIESGGTLKFEPNLNGTPGNALYGAANMVIEQGATCANESSWNTSLLLSGVLQNIDKSGTPTTTASAYSNGAFIDGITLSVNNLATYGSLQDPQSHAAWIGAANSPTLAGGVAPTIMFLGDSTTSGSNGVYTGMVGGYPARTIQTLLGMRADFEVIASQSLITENSAGCSVPYNEGHPGYTIAQITAAYAGYAASAGIPKLVIVMIGTNDMNAGRTLLQIQGDYAALLAQIHATGPTTQIVWMPPMTYVDGTTTHGSLAALQALQASVVAWMSTWAPAQPLSLYLASSQLAGAGQHLVDGVHPNLAGMGLIGDDVAYHLDQWLGPRTKLPIPRVFVTRQPWYSQHFAATTDGMKCAAHAGFNPGAGSFTLAFNFYMGAVPANSANPYSLAMFGTYGLNNFYNIVIFSNGTSVTLRTYWMSTVERFPAGAEAFNVSPGLLANHWNRIVLMADASTGTIGEYVNGQLAALALGAVAWTSNPGDFYLGFEPNVYGIGAVGYYSQVQAYQAVPARPGSVAALEAVLGDYYQSTSLIAGSGSASFMLDNNYADDVYAPGDPNPSMTVEGAAAPALPYPGGSPLAPWNYQNNGQATQMLPLGWLLLSRKRRQKWSRVANDVGEKFKKVA